MKTFILFDTLNLIHRSRHVVSEKSSIDLKIGMAFHILFSSLRKAYREFGGEHAVFCLEGKSWRKDFYPEYKYNRKVIQQAKTPQQQEEDELFMESANELMAFVAEKTNATVLQHPRAEADDMIALFIQSHPEDKHIIVSTDSDFIQLLAPNVEIWNGVTERHITLNGVYDTKGNPIIDKKTKAAVPAPDPEWELFYKCIRGDKSDHIFPAYPGAREKGTKNIIGMRDAFNDRESGGYNWNNFMLTKLEDAEGNEYRVKEKYEFNKQLVDLTAQPEEYRVQFLEKIAEAVDRKAVTNVGIHFLKFCSFWGLDKIAKYPDEFAKILNAKYV